MADRDNSIAAKVRRSRPTVPCIIAGEQFVVRVPTMGAIREFQAARDTEQAEARVARLLAECVMGDAGEPITEEQARELADAPWLNAPLIEAILELATTGGVKPAEAPPAPPAPTAGSEGKPEKETGAG